mgnify:CR=1 FL=1
MINKKIFVLGLACLLLRLPAIAAPEPHAASPSLLAAEFARHFTRLTGGEDIPGAAYAIVDTGGILALGTRGEKRAGAGQPIDPHTVFRIASLSKGFTAALAGRLASRGEIDLAWPLTRFLPEFSIDGPSEAITLLDIIGQSSGLTPHAFDNLLEAGVPPAAIRRRFAELKPICRPGTCYSYQNNLFSLIEPVLEAVSGESEFTALVARDLFEPLAMSDTSAGYTAWQAAANRAEPHVKRQGRWQTTEVQPNYYQVPAAAGINASITDMAKWTAAQLGGRPDVLDPAVVATLTTPRVVTPRDLQRKYWRDYLHGAWYGLGWRIYDFAGRTVIYHGGWVSGFRADLALDPEAGLGLVILFNAESNTIGELTTQFLAETRQLRQIADMHGATGDPGGDKSPALQGTSPTPLAR